MSSIFSELARALEGEPTRRMGERLGVSESEAQNGIQAGLPLLLSALSNNTRRRGGTHALAQALDRDHDGSVLNDLEGLAGGRYDDTGSGILKHVLGTERDDVEGKVAQFAGLDKATMGKLLVTLAPLILGWLGKMRRGGGSGGGGGLGDILRREDRQSRGRGRGGGLGDILGDVLGGSGPGKRAMPGCLGLLGGLLGRKR